jgi:TonB family protein
VNSTTQKAFLFWLIFDLTVISLHAQDKPPPNGAVPVDVRTRIGTLHNVILFAPMPAVPASALQQHLTGHGLYVLDIANGNVEDVPLLKSTGHKVLDDAAVAALWRWRFRPHAIYKATIPLQFAPKAPERGKLAK